MPYGKATIKCSACDYIREYESDNQRAFRSKVISWGKRHSYSQRHSVTVELREQFTLVPRR